MTVLQLPPKESFLINQQEYLEKSGEFAPSKGYELIFDPFFGGVAESVDTITQDQQRLVDFGAFEHSQASISGSGRSL
jgi:hypothetical protein